MQLKFKVNFEFVVTFEYYSMLLFESNIIIILTDLQRLQHHRSKCIIKILNLTSQHKQA